MSTHHVPSDPWPNASNPMTADEVLDVLAPVTKDTDGEAWTSPTIAAIEERGYRKAIEALTTEAAEDAELEHHRKTCAGTRWAPCTCSHNYRQWAATYLADLADADATR